MSHSQFRWLLVMPSSVWPYALETAKFYIYIYMDERKAGKWKAEAAPFRSRPQAGWNGAGWGSRGRASGGAIARARAGGRGDAVRWFRVRGRWYPHAASCALSLGRRGLASGVGLWRGDGIHQRRSLWKAELGLKRTRNSTESNARLSFMGLRRQRV